MGSLINLSTYLYYQWDNGSFADRNSFPNHAHYITTNSLEQHPRWTEHKIITGERHLEVVFLGHSDQPLTKVIMTLKVSEN